MKVLIPEISGVTPSNPIAYFLTKKPKSHDWKLVEKAENADVILNPINWPNFFNLPQPIKRNIQVIYEKAEKIGTLVISVNLGDYWLNFPDFALASNSIILSQTGDRENCPVNVKGFPVYWKNALKKFYKKDTIALLNKPKLPTVAFCGYAHSAWLKNTLFRVKNSLKNCWYYLGFSNFKMNEVFPAPLLRDKILDTCEASFLIKTDFIRRTQYKGGNNTSKRNEGFGIQQEFYDNIFNNPYVLCVRGNGNFSVRFYETLSLGRIPVVYDTQQLWPYGNYLNYNNSCVIIDAKQNKIQDIPEKIAEFHEELTEEEFKNVQLRNREIFVQYMLMPGVVANFKYLIGDV